MTTLETKDGFFNKYWFLSNFYSHPIEYEGISYPSSEHAYQAAKTFNIEERKQIAVLKTPGESKRAGRRVTLRPDWESIKISVMEEIVRIKFKDPMLRQKLIDTGSMVLIEYNTWNDTFWGVCRGKGRNELGKILMKIRRDFILETMVQYNQELGMYD